MTQPPPGGWPPPGYYPPPQGNYPPPPGWYPPPPGWDPDGRPSAGAIVGASFRWGWRKATSDPGPFVVAALPYLAALVLFEFFQLFNGSYTQTFESFGDYLGDVVASIPVGVAYAVVSAVLLTLVVRVALAVVDGRPASVGAAFGTDRLGTVVLAVVMVTLVGFVGTLLCLLPGLAAWVFFQFTYLFVLDQRMSAFEAMKASAALVRQNLGTSILLALAVGGTYIVGALACCVGVLLAVPVATLAQAYAYRRLSGAPIAP